MTYSFWISYPYFNPLFSKLRNTNVVVTVLVLGTSFKIMIVRIVFLYEMKG